MKALRFSKMLEWWLQWTYLNITVNKTGSLDCVVTVSLAFHPLLSIWPSVACKWYLPPSIFESPQGVSFQVLWVWASEGLSFHWGPPGNESPPQWKCEEPVEYQRCLLFRWQGGKETALLVGLLQEGSPSRDARATCTYINVPEEVLCKQLTLPSTLCPSRSQPWINFGTRPAADPTTRHRAVFCSCSLCVTGLGSMGLDPSFLRVRGDPKCTPSHTSAKKSQAVLPQLCPGMLDSQWVLNHRLSWDNPHPQMVMNQNYSTALYCTLCSVAVKHSCFMIGF